MAAQDTAALRRENGRLIRRAIQSAGAATKKDVMARTGLSFSTCNSLINAMVRRGLLLSAGDARPGETGRPSLVYRLDPDYRHFFCVRLEPQGKSCTLLGIRRDLNGRALGQSTAQCPAGEVLSALPTFCADGCRGGAVGLVGVSVPGVVGRDGRIGSCDCAALTGANLAELLRKTLHIPAVCENDMNLTAWGLAGQEERADSVAVLSAGREVAQGAGLVVEGKIVRGHTNFAGELSCLPVMGETSLARLAYQIAWIACLVDPAQVAVLGDRCAPGELPALRALVCRLLPPAHCPQLTVLAGKDSEEAGLTRLCLQTLDRELL